MKNNFRTSWGVGILLVYLLMSAVFPYIPERFAYRLSFSLLGTGLFIIGIYYMWLGRKEFGRAHKKLVIIGCPLAAVGIIFALVGGGAAAAGWEVSTTLAIVGISAVLVGLSLIFLVVHFENIIGKIFLIMGLLLAIGNLIAVVEAPSVVQVLNTMSMASIIIAYLIALAKVRPGVKWKIDKFLGHGIIRSVLEFFLMLMVLYFLMSGILVLAFQTDSYWMAVVSDSMKHDEDNWRDYFVSRGYDPSQIEKFPLQGGFEKGDLLFIQGVYSASEIAVGDVVIMNQGPGIMPLVHRVGQIWEENGAIRFRTKGDSNLQSYQYEVFEAEDVLGKVVFVIPKLGHVALWFQGQ